MGRIGQYLEYIRGTAFDKLKIDIGGGNNRIAQIFAPVGDDSQPLKNDYSVSISIPGTGQRAIIGWIDPDNENTSKPGARRFYSRNEEGVIVADITLDNDGSVVVKNDNGSIALQSGGDVVINGVTIDTSGNVNSPGTVTGGTDVVGGGVSLKGHDHNFTNADGVPSVTEGPN